MAGDKKKEKRAVLELDDATIEKAGTLLDEMLEEVKSRKVQNPALALIKHNISKIDALCEAGATLSQVYEKMNRQIKLGISASSFVQYVRRVRQETGSKLYVPREAKQKQEQAIMPEVSAKIDEQGWNCLDCASSSTTDVHEGKTYYECESCHICYAADENGNITTTRFEA